IGRATSTTTRARASVTTPTSSWRFATKTMCSMKSGKRPAFLFSADFFCTQTAMKPEFDAVQTPLEKGFTQIEASAGTGKTTTISDIVLRVLEQGIPIEQILSTNYTELATADLRGRIRDTFADALPQEHLPFVQE